MTVAQCQVLMRAQDPLTELGLTLGGHRKEDTFWEATLRALAARFGVEAEAGDDASSASTSAASGAAPGNVRHSSRVPLDGPHRHGAAAEAQVASPDG